MDDTQVVIRLRESDEKADLLIGGDRKTKERESLLTVAPKTRDRPQVVGRATAHLIIAALTRELHEMSETLGRTLQVTELELDGSRQVQGGEQVHLVVSRPELRFRRQCQPERMLHLAEVEERLRHDHGDLGVPDQRRVVQRLDAASYLIPASLVGELFELGPESGGFARRHAHDRALTVRRRGRSE